MAEFQDKLKYVEGATGVAFAIGKTVVAVDMFDKPSTCRKVWNRLLSGFVLDALEAVGNSDQSRASAADVKGTLTATSGMTWERTEPVGEGEEYRADSGADVHASALTFHESPVHLSVVTAV